jgi:simple sugar transport system permease protein
MKALVTAAAAAFENLLIPICALLASLVLFGMFLACLGNDPFGVFHTMYRGGFGSWFSWRNTLERAAPLMLTALCTALPAQLGLIVIGGEGALVAGGLVAAMTGWLKYYRGVNETIASLLFNYIAIALLNHLVTGPLRDPQSLNKPSTPPIGNVNMLGDIPGLGVHWGLMSGLSACIVFYVIFFRTTFGFAVRIAGGNLRAAKLVGLPVGRLTLITCFAGGAAAGLAGGIEVAAIHGTANATLAAGYGYAGILVAFLARQNPLAVIPVALILGGINASAGLLQRTHHLPDAAVQILQGMIFMMVLFSETYYGRLQALFESRRAA